MRKSTTILTAVIAVLALTLAWSLSQNTTLVNQTDTTGEIPLTYANNAEPSLEVSNVQGGLTEAEMQADNVIAANTATQNQDEVTTGTETALASDAEIDASSVATAVATNIDETNPAMTPVNLEGNTTDLNNQAPAAGEESADEVAVEESASEENVSATASVEPFIVDVPKALEDRSIGSADAPITVEDFSSLTCPHCANFHNEILPKIKENYIDTGKVRWIFRGYPLNEPALKAEMVSRCAPNDQYIVLQDLMYKEQGRWAFEENPLASLSMMLRMGGITQDMFLACVNNKALETGLANKVQLSYEKYKINSTPTFVLNGDKKISGAGSYTGFAFDLDTLLGETGNTDPNVVEPPAQSTFSKFKD